MTGEKAYSILLALAACATAFLAGCAITNHVMTARHNEEIATLQNASMQAKLKLQEQYRNEERTYAQKLSNALAERDKALADLDASRADADRVRRAAAGYRKRLSDAAAKSDAACKPFVESLGRCTRLLAEGADLVDEGCRFSGRVAADHDALATLLKSK
jgi:hypothetical protein